MTTDKNRQAKSLKAAAQKKMRSYIFSLSTNDDFLNSIAQIREMFSLPQNGFVKDVEDELAFIRALPAHRDGRGNETDIQKEVYELALRFHLTVPWLGSVMKYVLYDDFFPARIESLVQIVGTDALVEEQERRQDNNALHNIADAFPVGIFVSPYASQRDIVDYVKERYSQEIEPLLVKHREKDSLIGRVRARSESIAVRDAFICKHKDLPASKLAHLVYEKYGGKLLDYTYISKIIAKKCKQEKK